MVALLNLRKKDENIEINVLNIGLKAELVVPNVLNVSDTQNVPDVLDTIIKTYNQIYTNLH